MKRIFTTLTKLRKALNRLERVLRSVIHATFETILENLGRLAKRLLDLYSRLEKFLAELACHSISVGWALFKVSVIFLSGIIFFVGIAHMTNSMTWLYGALSWIVFLALAIIAYGKPDSKTVPCEEIGVGNEYRFINLVTYSIRGIFILSLLSAFYIVPIIANDAREVLKEKEIADAKKVVDHVLVKLARIPIQGVTEYYWMNGRFPGMEDRINLYQLVNEQFGKEFIDMTIGLNGRITFLFSDNGNLLRDQSLSFSPRELSKLPAKIVWICDLKDIDPLLHPFFHENHISLTVEETRELVSISIQCSTNIGT